MARSLPVAGRGAGPVRAAQRARLARAARAAAAREVQRCA